MLHLTKLAVGIRDIAHLRAVQAQRAASNPPLRHLTRMFPKRAAEVVAGGSIYWVVAGAVLVRQRVLDVVAGTYEDGTRCAGLMLDPELVPVLGRPCKPFQGWRYLEADQAPPDLVESEPASGEDGMPAALRQRLRELCLL